MAYDEALAERVRDLMAPRSGVTERKMFGGIAWMVNGNMAVGVLGDGLLVRLDPETAEATRAEPHVRPFDFTGRPMKGFAVVTPEGTEDDRDLASWIDTGAGYAASLPPK